MITHDQVIRTVQDPEGRKRSFSLDSEAIVGLKSDARERLMSSLGPGALDAAVAETRRVASIVARHVEGMFTEAARLSALYLVANEDALPALPDPDRETLDRFQSKFGVVNELSAFCQLEDWPRFFANADETALKAYLSAFILSEESGPNLLIRESLIDLDGA